MIHNKRVTDELRRYAVRHFQLKYEKNETWFKKAEAFRICFDAIYYELMCKANGIKETGYRQLIKGFLTEHLQ